MSSTRRYYFSTTAATPPARDPYWAVVSTSGAAGRQLGTSPAGGAREVFAWPGDPATNRQMIAAHYLATVPHAGELSGSFRLVVPALQQKDLDDARLQLRVRVLSADLGTVRGVLYAGAAAGTEFPSSTTLSASAVVTRRLAGALTAVAGVQATDVLCVELGVTKAGTGDGGVNLHLGDPTGSDYVDAENLPLTDGRPWIEFVLDDPPPIAPLAPADLQQTGATPTSATVAWTAGTAPAPAAGQLVDVNANHTSASGVLVSSGVTMQAGDVAVVVAYSGRSVPRAVTAVSITAAAKMSWTIVGTANAADGQPRYTFVVGVALDTITNTESQVGVTWNGGTAVGSMTSAVFRGIGSTVIARGAGETTPALQLAPGMGVSSYTTPRGTMPSAVTPATGWSYPGSSGVMGAAKPVTAAGPHQITMTGGHLAWIAVGTPVVEAGAPTGYQVRVDGGAPVDVGLATSWQLTGLQPSTSYLVEVRALNGTATSAWVPVTATTADLAVWVQQPFVSQTLLATAGLDPDDDQPAFQWHSYAAGWVHSSELRSRSLMGWTISTGRPGPRDRVAPATATVQLAARGPFAGLALPQLGERFRLALAPQLAALGIDPDDLPRFTGEVTDVALDTRAGTIQVTGVGQLARRGRQVVDVTGAPVEREGARLARMVEQAGGLQLGVVDAGRVDLAAPAAPAALQQLVDQLADSTVGQLVERRDGALDWHSVERRRDAVTVLQLDAGELLAGFTWAQRVGDLTNVVALKFAAGELRVEDSASVAARGEYPQQLDTLLLVPHQAQAIAGVIVGRYGRPTWQLPAVAVNVTRTLGADAAGAALQLQHGSRLQLDELPAGGPYTSRSTFVEGVVEQLTPRSWQLQLQVSDERLAGAPIRWRDVPAGDRWVDVPNGLTWLDVATYVDADELTPGT